MGGRLDAGCRDVARQVAWPRAQLRSIGLGHRRRPRRHHRHLRGDDLGVAGGLRPARDHRVAGDLCSVDVPGIALLGAHTGPQASDHRAGCCQPSTVRRRSGVDRQDAEARVAAVVPARSSPQHGHGDDCRQPGAGVVQHGGPVDAAVPVAAASLVDRTVRQLLHLVGTVRHDRLLGGRLDDRSASAGGSASRSC